MALDQLKAFLAVVQDDPALRQAISAAATADDVAQIGAGLGFSFSGDELLRLSGRVRLFCLADRLRSYGPSRRSNCSRATAAAALAGRESLVCLADRVRSCGPCTAAGRRQ